MKIERIRPILVDRCLLVQVYTDQGLVGIGEAGLWAHHRLVYEALQDLAEYYVGADPARIEHHYQVVSRNTHFMGSVLSAALSAVDVALWDIMGKAAGLPVYQLLGGKCRDRVRVFANVAGDTVDARAQSAAHSVARGYTSLRTIPFFPGWQTQTPSRTIQGAVEIVAAIRQAVGYEIDLGLEIHRNLTPDQAIILAGELAPYRILYYEDPLAPESLEALEYVAAHTTIPIATGERLYNMYQFKDLLDRKVVGMIRPDLSLVGGLTQSKKIAALAEASLVGLFPHLMGSPVNTAAFVQFGASIPNYVLQESNRVDDHPLNEAIEHALKLEQGHVIVPDRPGIGVEIREDRLAGFPYQPVRVTPHLRADGSAAP